MANKTKGVDLDIVELKIKMHTNKDTIEELTADKFKIDKKISGTYPFLCTNYRYNPDLLSLKTLPERISLFFDRAKLTKFANDSKKNSKQNVTRVIDDKELEQKIDDKIKNLTTLKLINAGLTLNAKNAVTDINKIKNINKQNIIDNLDENPKTIINNQSEFLNFLTRLSRKGGVNNVVAKENITIMLNALFPISFPIQDQVSLMDDSNFDLMTMVKRFFKSKEYVYLNIGKTSTVIQVIWLNTVSSNPTYYQLYQRIKKYYKMIFNYIDENITDPDIQKIVEDDRDDDSTKIKKIKAYVDKKIEDFILSKIKPSSSSATTVTPPPLPLPDKTLWILYFLLLNDDDPKKYNEFISKYVDEFVQAKSSSRYTGYYSNSDSNNKEQFFKSLQKISEVELRNAHMKEIADYLPPKRVSSNKKIVSELKDYSKFFDFYDNNKKQYSGIDKIGDGKYEIHIGVAVVGGKVTQSNYKFECKYNSQRLGNNFNYLLKNSEDDANENVHLYGYIDLENVKDPTEYIGTVNSIMKKDEKKTSNGDNRDYRDGMFNQTRFNGGLNKTRKYRVFKKKTRKLLQRDFKEKQTNDN